MCKQCIVYNMYMGKFCFKINFYLYQRKIRAVYYEYYTFFVN
jgi:hypothetical protein